MIGRRLLALLALLATAFSLSAESDLGFGIRLLGADMRLSSAPFQLLPGRDSVFGLAIGGGYQPASFYRLNDERYEPGDIDREHTANPNGDLLVGLTQGLVAAGGRDLLSLFFFHRTGLEYYLQNDTQDALLLAAVGTDTPALLHSEALAGITLDTTTASAHPLLRQGFYLQVSMAAAPRWLANDLVGSVDFREVAAMALGITRPLERRGVWFYGIGRIEADLLWGDSVPALALTAFGGLDRHPGVGGAVRGFDDGRFDGRLKAAASAEVRGIITPLAVFGFLPGFAAFVDAGLVADDSDDAPITLLSTGVAGTLRIPYLGGVTVLLGPQVTLLPQTGLSLYLGLGYHAEGPMATAQALQRRR